MVLSYSRALHAVFTLDQSLESFLRGHVEAFAVLGIARTLVYDNLRSVVLARQGSAIHFHPRLLELAGHYHFAPRPCAPARANEKGRVERQIQYLRDAFFTARPFRDLDDLHTQFQQWRDTVAHQRPHPEQRDRAVAAVFAEEQPRLLPRPQHPFETTFDPEAFLPLKKDAFHILVALADSDRHGYSIMREVAMRTDDSSGDRTTMRIILTELSRVSAPMNTFGRR